MVRLHSAAFESPQRLSRRRSDSLKELSEASDTQADALGCLGEIPIPGHKDDFLIVEFERGGEMNRVIAAQSQVFRVLACTASELLIDADRD